MFKVILALFVSFFLTACETNKPRVITETKTVYVKVPEYLLEPCAVNLPKPKEEYLLLKPHEREAYLADYSVSLLGTVKTCNIQLKKISDFNNTVK